MRAQQGDLESVAVLADLMAHHDEALVWNGCASLIGFAGSQSLIFNTAATLLHDPSNLGVQWYASSMMLNACSLRAVEPLLILHQAATDRAAQRHIEHSLSALLEEWPGEIDDGSQELEIPDPDYPEPFVQNRTTQDYAGYVDLVRQVSARVARRLTSPDQPVTAGAPLDVTAVVLRLRDRIGSGAEDTPRIEWERMLFEAFTGLDCTGFYREGVLNASAALEILESFLASERPTEFATGTRYFFGHPIGTH
jgi:hypothetical protein